MPVVAERVLGLKARGCHSQVQDAKRTEEEFSRLNPLDWHLRTHGNSLNAHITPGNRGKHQEKYTRLPQFGALPPTD